MNVPTNSILLGCKGSASPQDIQTLAKESIDQDLLGIMVWYSSVIGGLKYSPSWDASSSEESIQAFVSARNLFQNHH